MAQATAKLLFALGREARNLAWATTFMRLLSDAQDWPSGLRTLLGAGRDIRGISALRAMATSHTAPGAQLTVQLQTPQVFAVLVPLQVIIPLFKAVAQDTAKKAVGLCVFRKKRWSHWPRCHLCQHCRSLCLLRLCLTLLSARASSKHRQLEMTISQLHSRATQSQTIAIGEDNLLPLKGSSVLGPHCPALCGLQSD